MPTIPLKPFWSTNDNGATARLFAGDVRAVASRLPEGFVQSIVTSPPYWGIRDYHGVDRSLELGQEDTPEEFVARLVEVFRLLSRVLRRNGTLWLNLGDCYGPKRKCRRSGLLGVPWMVARALQDDGWILRQDIIWWKPDPMPSPVFNPCRNAHEYVFLFSQSKDWYYDADAIREEGTRSLESNEAAFRDVRESATELERGEVAGAGVLTNGRVFGAETKVEPYATGTRNKPSVWKIAKEGYAGKHFATFPRKLVEPCVLAGTSAHGECAECGSPYRRVVDKLAITRDRPNDYVKRTGESEAGRAEGNSCPNSVAGVEVITKGWEKTCGCICERVRPQVVLDPFAGSGTALAVALDLGRFGVGIDLSEEYLRNSAIPRIEGLCLGRPAMAGLVGKRREAVSLGIG